MPCFDRDQGLALGRADHDLEGGHALVVGEPQELGEEAQVGFAAVQEDFTGFRVVDVVVVEA